MPPFSRRGFLKKTLGTAWTGAEYDVEDPTTTFLSVFWGDHPKSGRHVPGEVSFDPSGHGLEHS